MKKMSYGLTLVSVLGFWIAGGVVADEGAAPGLPAVVVEVEVLDEWPAADAMEGLPATESAVRVTAVLRGGVQVDEELVVRSPGGVTADGERVKVLGTPELVPGTFAVVGLEPGVDGTWRVVRTLPSVPSTVESSKGYKIQGEWRSIGGKCLDVLGSDTADGTPVVYFECTGNANQQWTIRRVPGREEIRGIGNRCLVPGPIGPSGHPEAVLGACNTSQSNWLIVGFPPQPQQLVHRDTGLCLDVLNGSTQNLTPIILFNCTGNANQDWTFIPTPVTTSCIPTNSILCLQSGRFAVQVDWKDFGMPANTGPGQIVTQSNDSGLFWFFGPNNWEMLIKVIDACGFPPPNDRFWVFFAATTNVEFTVQVIDTLRGESLTYFNPLGNPASAVTDTDAFATCP